MTVGHILPGNIVRHVLNARIGEVTSTVRRGDDRTAHVKWHEGDRQPVDPALLVKVGHVGNPKHLLKGLFV